MNNLKELANKQYKTHKLNRFFVSSIYFISCLTSVVLLIVTLIDKHSNPPSDQPLALFIVFVSILSLAIVGAITGSITTGIILIKNAKLINEIVRKDSLSNYVQNGNREWKDEFINNIIKKNKKLIKIFSLSSIISLLTLISFLISSLVIIKDWNNESDPLSIVSIVFIVISGLSLLISVIVILCLKIKPKEYEIHGYLFIRKSGFSSESLFYNNISFADIFSSVAEFTLPDEEKVIYISGALFPINLLDLKEKERNSIL